MGHAEPTSRGSATTCKTIRGLRKADSTISLAGGIWITIDRPALTPLRSEIRRAIRTLSTFASSRRAVRFSWGANGHRPMTRPPIATPPTAMKPRKWIADDRFIVGAAVLRAALFGPAAARLPGNDSHRGWRGDVGRRRAAADGVLRHLRLSGDSGRVFLSELDRRGTAHVCRRRLRAGTDCLRLLDGRRHPAGGDPARSGQDDGRLFGAARAALRAPAGGRGRRYRGPAVRCLPDTHRRKRLA